MSPREPKRLSIALTHIIIITCILFFVLLERMTTEVGWRKHERTMLKKANEIETVWHMSSIFFSFLAVFGTHRLCEYVMVIRTW